MAEDNMTDDEREWYEKNKEALDHNRKLMQGDFGKDLINTVAKRNSKFAELIELDEKTNESKLNIDSLIHASVCLDNALEEAEKGNDAKAVEYIEKCLNSLESV